MAFLWSGKTLCMRKIYLPRWNVTAPYKKLQMQDIGPPKDNWLQQQFFCHVREWVSNISSRAHLSLPVWENEKRNMMSQTAPRKTVPLISLAYKCKVQSTHHFWRYSNVLHRLKSMKPLTTTEKMHYLHWKLIGQKTLEAKADKHQKIVKNNMCPPMIFLRQCSDETKNGNGALD